MNSTVNRGSSGPNTHVNPSLTYKCAASRPLVTLSAPYVSHRRARPWLQTRKLQEGAPLHLRPHPRGSPVRFKEDDRPAAGGEEATQTSNTHKTLSAGSKQQGTAATAPASSTSTGNGAKSAAAAQPAAGKMTGSHPEGVSHKADRDRGQASGGPDVSSRLPAVDQQREVPLAPTTGKKLQIDDAFAAGLVSVDDGSSSDGSSLESSRTGSQEARSGQGAAGEAGEAGEGSTNGSSGASSRSGAAAATPDHSDSYGHGREAQQADNPAAKAGHASTQPSTAASSEQRSTQASEPAPVPAKQPQQQVVATNGTAAATADDTASLDDAAATAAAAAQPQDDGDAAVAATEALAAAQVETAAALGAELAALRQQVAQVLAVEFGPRVDEAMARYKMLDDRMDGLERAYVDLARELRASGALPGSPADAAASAAGGGSSTAATPGGGGAAVSSSDSSGSGNGGGNGFPAAAGQAATVAAPASGADASAGPMAAVAAVGGAVAQVMTGGNAPQPPAVVPGGKDSSRGQKYNIGKIQSSITEVINSGYLESAKQLRETLMVHEWEMTARHWAQRAGVARFEHWCAEQPYHLEGEEGPEAVTYDLISALYEDPSDLSVLPSDRLRMMARSFIEQELDTRRGDMYKQCTEAARELAKVKPTDLLPKAPAGAWALVKSLFTKRTFF